MSHILSLAKVCPLLPCLLHIPQLQGEKFCWQQPACSRQFSYAQNVLAGPPGKEDWPALPVRKLMTWEAKSHVTVRCICFPVTDNTLNTFNTLFSIFYTNYKCETHPYIVLVLFCNFMSNQSAKQLPTNALPGENWNMQYKLMLPTRPGMELSCISELYSNSKHGFWKCTHTIITCNNLPFPRPGSGMTPPSG